MEPFRIMKGLFEANSISVRLCTPDPPESEKSFEDPIPYKNAFDTALSLSEASLQRAVSRCDAGILYYYQDCFLLTYAIYPFRKSDRYPGKILVLGPLLLQPAGDQEYDAFLSVCCPEKTEEIMSSIRAFYLRIPVWAPFDCLDRSVHYFLNRMCDENPEVRFQNDTQTELLRKDGAQFRFDEEEKATREMLEERYHAETKMLDAVRSGDGDHVLRLYRRFRKTGITQRITDELRSRKNFALIFNTLLRKAAEDAGVHPLHIDALSRRFHIEIESCHTVAALDALSEKMIYRYCDLVNTYARNEYSALIKNCLNFIDFHYTEELTLHRLAKEYFVTDSYLSAQFARETGQTLIGYVHHVRLQRSLNLLRGTDLSIREIALRCGFSSYNYYSRLFRNMHGISPQGYRKQYRTESLKQV